MNNSEKILITGATGMVGGHLVGEMLRESSSEIILAVRSLANMDRLWWTLSILGFEEPQKTVVDRLSIRECSLNNPLQLREVMAGVDTVYHCAAGVSLGKGDNLVSNNVEITSCMVDTALECGVKLFVHISSIASLGASTEAKPLIDEQTELTSIEGHSQYTISKFLSENQVKRGSEFGLRSIVVNPAIILGEGRWGGNGSSAIIPMLAKGLPIVPDGVTASVDVRDVVRAMRMLAQEPRAVGNRFVLAAENLSFRDLATLVALAAGKPTPVFTVRRWAVEIVRVLMGTLSALTGVENRLSKSVVRNSVSKNYYNGDKIKQFIPFEYTPIKHTVERIVKLYKEDRR